MVLMASVRHRAPSSTSGSSVASAAALAEAMRSPRPVSVTCAATSTVAADVWLFRHINMA